MLPWKSDRKVKLMGAHGVLMWCIQKCSQNGPWGHQSGSWRGLGRLGSVWALMGIQNLTKGSIQAKGRGRKEKERKMVWKLWTAKIWVTWLREVNLCRCRWMCGCVCVCNVLMFLFVLCSRFLRSSWKQAYVYFWQLRLQVFAVVAWRDVVWLELLLLNFRLFSV